MATLNDLFPGQTGRLELIRVMLRLQLPELRQQPRDEDLKPELEERLRKGLQEVRRG